MPHGHAAHALVLCLGDGEFGGELGHHLAKSIIADDLGCAGRLAHDLGLRRRADHPFPDLADVLEDPYEPVGVVPGQAILCGRDAGLRRAAMLFRRARRAEEMEGDVLQLFTGKRGHKILRRKVFIIFGGRGGRIGPIGRIGAPRPPQMGDAAL